MTNQIADNLAHAALAFAAVLLAGCIAIEVYCVVSDMRRRRRQ